VIDIGNVHYIDPTPPAHFRTPRHSFKEQSPHQETVPRPNRNRTEIPSQDQDLCKLDSVLLLSKKGATGSAFAGKRNSMLAVSRHLVSMLLD
jgi:hypothetical protein